MHALMVWVSVEMLNFILFIFLSPPLLDKALKETLDQVLLSGYFDRIPSHQNGVCEEEEEEEEPAAAAAAAGAAAAAESSEAEEQTADPGLDHFLMSCHLKSPNIIQQ